ncbi:MAG: IS5 family transposase, partial [Candidatus Entotheonellia bacterium]
MVQADGQGIPLGIGVEKASPSEVTLLERTRDSVKVKRRRGIRRCPYKPERLMADRGYDRN